MPIYHAEMSFYVGTRSNDTPMTITMWAVAKPWLLKEATWLQAKAGLQWQAPGAGGESDCLPEPIGEVIASDRGIWLTYDVTRQVQEWIKDPLQNQGVLLTGDAASAVQYDLTSADSRDERHRPRLVLTFPTGALALGPVKLSTPTPSLTPTADANRPESVNIARLLPLGSTILARASASLTPEGARDIVVAYRTPGASGVHVGVFYFPEGGSIQSDYRLYWSSNEIAGKEPVGIDLIDLTGDGTPDIVVGVANPGGAGRMAYVFAGRPAGFRLLAPIGGYAGGKDYFGDTWFELADTNGDGRIEILASHGNQTDTYAWDGVNFVAAKP
jgi:hypothetical protein